MIVKQSRSFAWMQLAMAIILSIFWAIVMYKTLWCFVLPTLISACFFFVASIRNLQDDNPRITMDAEGIAIRGTPKISWYMLKNVRSEFRQRGHIFILLEFVNGKEQCFDATDLDVRCEEVLAYIRKRLAEIEEARAARQSTPLLFGKYRSDHQSTMEDFAVAEWHPTDKDVMDS
jgi:hypothetical protein